MKTILIVDDEPVVLKLMGLVLQRGGFKVLSAKNGLDAVYVSELHRGEIDLLISDLVMPGMDGPSLARKLWSANPSLPVLFVSGSQEGLLMSRDRPYRFLPKPFSPLALTHVVCSMLDGNHREPARLKRAV